MGTREPLFPEFKTSKTLRAFKLPPRGKEVLVFFMILHALPKNRRDGKQSRSLGNDASE